MAETRTPQPSPPVASGCEEADAGADDQGPVGTGQDGAHRFDGLPVFFAIFPEVGEVMDKGGVDDAVGGGGAALQAFGIFDRPPVDFCAGGGYFGGGGVRAGEAQDLVAISDQFLNYGRADKAGGPGNKYAHRFLFFLQSWPARLPQDKEI